MIYELALLKFFACISEYTHAAVLPNGEFALFSKSISLKKVKELREQGGFIKLTPVGTFANHTVYEYQLLESAEQPSFEL